MTTTDVRPQTGSPDQSRTEVPLAARARKAGALVIGGLAILLLLQPIGPLPLQGWVPVIIGITYVAAGLASGRRGPLIAPGLVIGIWGLAPLSTRYGYEFNGMFYLTLGTGLLVAALLAERGWRIAATSLAIPVLFIGGVMSIAPTAGRWLTTVLCGLLVAWAAFELRPQTESAEIAAARSA
jgi:hypothetical protein